ncbi:MAG TPA: helix-turn-helix transcriptional regulator [Gemmatimonadaceae bacterium]|nr:helix-turn-helix transcriptional regulator [Gemmatimonadaceae bacterium]
MSPSTATEQQVFQSVKRVCYAGLDSVALRAELARRVERVVPTDQSHFWTLDPDTGLISHGVARNPSPRLLAEFVGHHYPDDEATQVIDQARAGAIIRSGAGPTLAAMLRREGIHQDMRTLFFTPEACWGSWCMLRGDSPAFTEREARFMERIAPHVAEGLKSAALLELASRLPDGEEQEEPAPAPAVLPGVLVIGPRGDVVLRTAAVAAALDDLGANGAASDDRLPFAVLSVRGRLLRRRPLADDAPGGARLRARGRSGSWYALHATLAEPDASGLCSTVVTIEPAARREVAPLLFRLYGLSPREREVLVWVVRGEPTKRIAHHLGLSMHTVQDYLDKACDKVGVRGRKALVAKLFQDGFAPGISA